MASTSERGYHAVIVGSGFGGSVMAYRLSEAGMRVCVLERSRAAHPLGGCPMGRDEREGVVGADGQVFGHPGLFIADGSVMPGPVGANPSLTIAALADRFADRLIGASDA